MSVGFDVGNNIRIRVIRISDIKQEHFQEEIFKSITFCNQVFYVSLCTGSPFFPSFNLVNLFALLGNQLPMNTVVNVKPSVRPQSLFIHSSSFRVRVNVSKRNMGSSPAYAFPRTLCLVLL